MTTFALAVATSAEATSPAPLNEPELMITKIGKADPPCDLPSQVRINGICMLRAAPHPVRRPEIRKPNQVSQPCDLPSQALINGICMLRAAPHQVRGRDYRGCAKWNEGICVEYY
jgi:hypothetical protein